jgi:hypothetical protein
MISIHKKKLQPNLLKVAVLRTCPRMHLLVYFSLKTTGILNLTVAMGIANSGALHLPDASLLVDQFMSTMEQVGGFIFYLTPNLRKCSRPPIQLIEFMRP